MKQNSIFVPFLMFLLILLSENIFAQFSISGEFKMRGEYRDGYLSLRDSSKTPYATILGRARLAFDYKNEKIATRFSLNDAWVFGQNSFSSDTITRNTVNIFEAWFQYSFTKSFGLKAGRTEIAYDDERLFGLSNWTMWGTTHDALIAQFDQKKRGYWGHIGFSVNNIAPPTNPYLNSYNVRNNYKYLGYLYGNFKLFDNKLTLTYLEIIDVFQKNPVTTTKLKTTYDTLFIRNQNDSIIGTTLLPVVTKTTTTEDFPDILYARGTFGASACLELNKWSFFVNGYYQYGHIRDGRQLSSYFYALWASFQPVKQLKLQVGWEQLSGNNYSDTSGMRTKVKGFSTLYGTSHRAYGYMDLFSTIVKDNLSVGLNDLYGRATAYFNDKMSLEATYRWFSIPYGFLSVTNPKKGQLPYTSVKTNLGSEIDLMYVYKPIPNLELNAAYCFFLPTATMETLNKVEAGKSKFAQYAYIMDT
ncbi:MAG: alginate export family protein [Bacteroidota bacterium]